MQEYDYLNIISFDMVKNILPKRLPDSNKGTFGRLLCICGSKNMPGAAFYCIAAASRCGVGLIQSVIPEDIYSITASKISESLFYPICNDFEKAWDTINSLLPRATAVLVGCGMGWNKFTQKIVYKLLKESSVPLVIDADGINVISENIDILKEAKSDVILTPHIKEMSRLLGESTDYVSKNKFEIAKNFSKKYNLTLVLKDSKTVISDVNGHLYLNSTGNESMAKGGSGDVLAGIIGSLAAQGVSALNSAIISVFIHGRSGDICKEKLSSFSVIPTDIINNLSEVFLELDGKVIQ